jgi:carboxypeptidase PM20D1
MFKHFGRPYRLVAILLAGVASLPLYAGPAEHLAKAVSYQTISSQNPAEFDPAPFREFNAFLRTTYPAVFASLRVDIVNDYSLMLTWPGRDGEAGAILFTAHTDVVPIEPGTESDWTHPAFAGVIEDGVIYGRGTLDDKVGVISLLEAVSTLVEAGFQPRKTVVLAFGHDEEVSGEGGAALLAELMRERGLHFDWMVDEGGLVVTGSPVLPERPLAMINVAEKGYLTLILEAKGEGGHSSQPPLESTIGRLSRAMAKVEDNPFPAQIVPPVDAMLEALAPYAQQPRKWVMENLWLTSPMVAAQMAKDPASSAMVRTTTALTMFNAGVKENVVPQRAEARLNFRLLPGMTAEMVIDRVTELIDDPQVTIRHEPWVGRPGVADHEGEGFKALVEAVASVYPEAVSVPSLLVATTDTRHYRDLADNQYRFHGMRVPIEHVSGIHGTDEQITVESFINTVRIAELFIRNGSR